ncbi:MAG TPA: DNA internalization-related competence protein ComEC/Rec2 [Nocardioidaceae bacterium]|nr:DNA internalization-related competence protein ComEC/Rec2 [Nocardioidaceae bacterium]
MTWSRSDPPAPSPEPAADPVARPVASRGLGSRDAGSARERADFRLLPAALAVWCAAGVAQGLPVRHNLAGAGLLVLLGLLVARRRRVWGVPVLLVAAALAVTALRLAGVEAGSVRALADERAVVSGTAQVVTDPKLRPGRFGDFVVLRVLFTRVTGRGTTTRVRTPVLVIADPAWRAVVPGQRLQVSGRLDAADGHDLAGVLVARGPPVVVGDPGPVGRAVNDLRAGLRESVSGLPAAERSLVPALVDGDDSGMPEEVADDFRTTGLTHLLAVSGANLTLVLAFVLVLGRWCGVRARGLLVLGVLGVVGFVLLARTEPSVLRAAAMGVVALAGLSAGGRRRGTRALCVAVVVLVLLDPWLARSVGFALSVLATAGILLLAPPWRDALSRWMPRLLAEALAVPLAAQIVCTPLVAAISDQVSVVAVFANLLAAPAVAPATVLGVVATLLAPVSGLLASVAGWLAGRAAWWIITVAERGAELPGAAVPWSATPGALVLLTTLCLLGVLAMGWVLSRPVVSLALALTAAVLVVRPADALGWPPADWVMVACDVGQGDAVVLNAGDGDAVVVDTGPDPGAVDRCLDRLEVESVPLVVLSHLHADHAEGLSGVSDGRTVGEVEIGSSSTPAEQFRSVLTWTQRNRISARRAVYSERRRLGALSWRVIAPEGAASWSPTAESSDENNASLVLLARYRGLRMLLTGDIEPEAQQALLRSGYGLRADVLKVPHHGSRYQEPAFLTAVGADVAVVSAGRDNDYGHPAETTLRLLQREGTDVYRTDLAGDVAVLWSDGDLRVKTRR